MSMLLEALKKAALEKKGRLDQKTALSNLAEAHKRELDEKVKHPSPPESILDTLAEETSSAEENAPEEPEQNKPDIIHDLSDEIDLSLVDQEIESDDLTSSESSLQSNTLEVDYTPEPEQSPEHQQKQEDEPTIVEDEPPTQEIEEQAKIDEPQAESEETLISKQTEESKEDLIASIVADALAQTEDKKQELTLNVAEDKSQTKEAFSQLIEKGKMREKVQNRRLVIISSSLVFISITLGVLYYYFLSANESDFLVRPYTPKVPVYDESQSEPSETEIQISEQGSESESESVPNEIESTTLESKTLIPNSSISTDKSANSTKPNTVPKKQQAKPSVQAKPAAKKAKPSPSIITMDPLPETIQKAYFAYQNGNYELAMENYQQAYSHSPHNKDVLLGLAATSVQLDRAEDALLYYQQVLKNNPKEPTAMAGLLSVTSLQANDPQVESRLSNLIYDNPNDAHLYFLMGNLYQTQKNWAAANTQFAKAVSLEMHNSNYLYNLAISYDQLGQTIAALHYYQQAYRLAQSGHANFSKKNLSARIEALIQINSE